MHPNAERFNATVGRANKQLNVAAVVHMILRGGVSCVADASSWVARADDSASCPFFDTAWLAALPDLSLGWSGRMKQRKQSDMLPRRQV